jgi:hypothetical protein
LKTELRERSNPLPLVLFGEKGNHLLSILYRSVQER